MSGIQAIPGGATDIAMRAGGEALRRNIDLLCAGGRADVVLAALTSSLGLAACQLFETEAEALAFVQVLAGDLANLVQLNHAETRARMAARLQQPAADFGLGRVQ